MRDNGHCMTFSWPDNDHCTISDSTTGKFVRLDLRTGKIVGDLDKNAILMDMKNVIEFVNTYPRKAATFMKNNTGYTQGVVAREFTHGSWDLVENGYYATAKEGLLTHHKKVNFDNVCRCINATIAMLEKAIMPLNPKSNIFRVIADCRLLVGVHDGHCIAVAQKNVENVVLHNALVDGEYYEHLIVGTSREQNSCTIYRPTDGEPIFQCPLDASVVAYFRPAEDEYQ